MIQKLLAACVIAAGWGAAAYELAPEKLQWELTPHCRIMERDGRRILTVQVPEGAKDIRGRNCAFAKIDLTPFQGGIFECSVLFRGKAVKAAAEWFPGVSFSFYFKDETTGQEEWPGIARVLGTFDWKTGAFSENIPKGAKTGILRLGIENASGEAEFDLSTLKISTPDPLLKEKGETLSAAEAAEFDRMKRRITDSLLSKRAENEERIQADLALLRPDGSFSDVDYRDTNRSAWKTSQHLNYTIELARAWAKPGHPRYHDREVGEAVRKAVGCWSRNKFQNSNWWWNDMFVPQKMGEILLMADPLFPEGPEREAALDVCRQAMLLHRYTGNNRVFIAANLFYRALLERNERALSVAAGALSEEIRMAPVENKSDWSFGGIRADGSDGVSEVSYIMLETIEELHILQPGSAIHVSARTPERFLRAGCKVIRQGHGYPSVFNPDVYVQELMRQGKSLRDAREGGCSGCIEVGAFGKEAYVLTGYLNVPKILEVTLHNGVDPVSGRKVGLETGDPRGFRTYEELYAAFIRQIHYFVDMKVRVSNYIDRMFAKYAPATFLSLFIDDCIAKGKDYYNCGPRYNTTYIQCTGLGTITDSLSSLRKHVFEDKTFTMQALLDAMADNFEGHEPMRQMILNRTPFFGNDDPYADQIAVRVFDDLYDAIEGKPNTKGECFHLNMLSTTCHVYFGKVMGATPNGRLAGRAISDGTSPSHGADTHGPSAVVKSLGKLDQVKSGGTLLNQRFLPSLLRREEDISKLASLIGSYFALGGHHIQFNIVDTETLYAAQKCPEDYRDLLVRVAGYSDYFNDMNADLQADVIARTEQETF